MTNLEYFSSQASLSSAENIQAFIHLCRYELTVFGADLDWGATAWSGVVTFTKLGKNRRGYKESDRFDAAFINFAKAYFRYQQGHKPTKTKNESKALRVIEAALLQVHGVAEIAQLDVAVLDEAAVLGRKHYSAVAAYHCGGELLRLAQFVSEKQLISTNISTWKNPIKKPANVNIQTGPKAKANQDAKLPSKEALDALAEIFASNPSDLKDIFTSSTFAMTMCAPVRISEVLDLPADCEVEELDSKGELQYGWRFYSEA